MKKKILTICLFLFFGLILAAGLAAENIHYNSLPQVYLALPEKDIHLRGLFPAQAVISYHRAPHSLHAGYEFSSLTLLTENGAKVDTETPIYSVPLEEIRHKKNILELKILDLKEQNEEIELDQTISEDRKKLRTEINLYEINELTNQVIILQTLEDNGGLVYSEYEGIINFSVAQGAFVRSGQEVAVVLVDTGIRNVRWQMSGEEGHLFRIGDGVEMMLTVTIEWFGLERSIEEKYTLNIGKIEYFPQSRVYDFTAQVRDSINLDMADGAKLTVYCRYLSAVEYGCVVPTEVITFESETRGYVYVVRERQRIYGTEYYVRPYAVEVLRSLSGLSALTNKYFEMEMVISSDQPLADGSIVRILRPVGE